jgi:DNA-binding NtrC family response regulator
MIRLVLYSPDPKLQPLLASALKPEYSVQWESSRERLKQVAACDEADVLVLDLDSNHSSLEEQLSFYDGLRDSHLPIVVMTDDLRRSTATEFLQRGAYDCVRKPPSLIELKVVVRRAYEHALMKRELEDMRRVAETANRCDQLIGSSGRSQVVYDLIRRVANLSAFVMITGESGTGKELVARAIHNLGSRAKHPFIPFSCGAVPESLIESELFGHEKGAFTGSTGARVGYLEQAGDGTLFLDEIGELSLSTQVKLLRVLQEREFSRLGSNKTIPLRARVIFATHRNLQDMADQGTFRRDLFFRVTVMTIPVPPLRDRTEDIPVLARHFLASYALEYGKPVQEIRPSAMAALVDYSWPGNIRELENVIQSAVIRTDDTSIGPGDLPESIQQLSNEMCFPSVEPESFEDLVRQYKINLAQKKLVECDGNKSLAARKLKVSRAYFHRLLRAEPEEERLDAVAEVAEVIPIVKRPNLRVSSL